MKLARASILSLSMATTAMAQTNALNSSGNVGIGTTTPESHLHVKNAGAANILIDQTADGGRKYSISSRWGGYFTIWDETNAAFASSPRLAINPGTGGVGIGTLFPYGSLEVIVKSPHGQIGNNNTIALRNSDSSAGNATSIINYDASNTWNANAAIDFLNHNHGGANGAASIRFYTKKTSAGLAEAMRITDSGNVGIGTNSPLNKFDVKTGTDQRLLVRSGADWGGGNSGVALDARNDAESGSIPLRIRASSIALDANVGISTTNPLAKLHIKSNYSGEVGLMIEASDTPDPEKYNLRLQPYVLGAGMVGYKFQTRSDVGGTNTPLAFGNSGNVGIGTTNPQHKLAVNGTIKAKEIIVETTGWSDYVFADDYRLAPLSEIEAHIKTNKHLPGIPSAAQVASEGVSIGDMQARLLAKIEELTLHQIAQEKLLKAQSDELAALRTEVRTLRNQ